MQQIINNRFVVKQKLGEGSFGNVFLVLDQDTKEICALKLIRPELAADNNVHDRFEKEALTWMECGKHPNIVNVRSVDRFNGSLFIALEFIAPNELGVNTLDKQIWAARPSLRKTLKWAIDICEGMKHAISNGVIAHRDLKPSNLMIDASENIRITDFGLAVFSINPSSPLVNTSPSGTPPYMPPEQFIPGSKVGERSDIYSVGIILYQMISGGQLPFRINNANPRECFAYFRNLHLTFELPRFESPVYPLIAKCLKKEPQDRYASFAELSKELKALYLTETGVIYQPMAKDEMTAAENVNYAVSYMILGDNTRALRYIDKAINAAPRYMPAYNNKAAILADLGKVSEAVSIWHQLTKKAPNLGRPHYNLGNAARDSGDIRAAVKHYQRSIELEPDYVQAFVNLAICYQNSGHIEQAVQLYDQAIRISPNDAKIIYNKAYLLYEAGRYEEAKAMFSQAIHLDPRYVSSYNYLGLCHQAMNQHELALSCFEKALAIDPNYPYALKNRQALLQELSKQRAMTHDKRQPDFADPNFFVKATEEILRQNANMPSKERNEIRHIGEIYRAESEKLGKLHKSRRKQRTKEFVDAASFTIVWAACVFLIVAIFEPFGHHIDDDELIVLLAIMALPVAIIFIRFLYVKFVR